MSFDSDFSFVCFNSTMLKVITGLALLLEFIALYFIIFW